jgi:Iap family predicted aminopeptidase
LERGGTPDRIDARHRELDVRLRDAGVRALLSADGAPNNVLSARDRVYGGTIGALPAAQIGREDAQTIRHLLSRGPVRIALELRNRITTAPVTVHNVVGELRGRERPDEWVIVGAHLDSWDFSAAAQDNAAGVAMVLAAARAIAAREARPRRSIRFALWGGEEQGQLGSSAYVRAHQSELDRAIATLNSDAGTGRIIGWTTPGRADVMSAVRQLMLEVLRDLGSESFDRSLQYAFQSDGAPFILAGVPTLDLNADDSKYEGIHHTPTDTIEQVDARNLAVGAATVAATAFAVADAPKRIAPHLDRDAVRRLLKKGE